LFPAADARAAAPAAISAFQASDPQIDLGEVWP
jgi:hypothetical protein